MMLCRWFAACFGFAVAGATFTRADQASADRAPATAAQDSLAMAQHQLDQLKVDTAVSAAGAQAGAVPQISVPELSPQATPVPLAPTTAARALQKRSANWLVDAMRDPKNPRDRDAKDPRARSDRRDGVRPQTSNAREPAGDDTVGLDSDEPGVMTAADSRPGSSADEKERPPPARPDTVFNPLTQYLSGWMTPQDYSLLRQSSSNGHPHEGPASGSGTSNGASVVGTDQPLFVPGDALEAATASRPAYTPSATATANPFLEALNLPNDVPTSASASATQMPPSPTGAWVPEPAPMTESAPAKPVIPDFAKPSTDDRYFKPLKRF